MIELPVIGQATKSRSVCRGSVAEMGDYLSSSCKIFRLAHDKIILAIRLPEDNPDNENEDYIILRYYPKDYPRLS